MSTRSRLFVRPLGARLSAPFGLRHGLVQGLPHGVLIAVLCWASPLVWAQQAQLRVSASPYYVDVPIDIEIVAEGFEQSPQPTIDAAPPPGATLTLTGVSPHVSSSIRIVNGQMTRNESARFVYHYRLLAEQPGHVEVGPFRVSQGSRSASTQTARFEIENVPSAAGQRFRLLLPEGPLWVGQRVPVTVQWWLTESFAERLAGRRARVPLFDQVDRFKFEDAEVANTRSTLMVDTVAGTLELPATVSRDEWQGEQYLVVSAMRTMIPLKAGEIALEPASIVTEEAIQWSSDFFGNRVPSRVRRLRVEDEPRVLAVQSPPPAGRPASFSGAIGKGFTIEVSADRSVVQTGDPIRLTIRVRGDAALETVSLPRLAAAGLSADDFKIPTGDVAGIVEDGVKRFDVVLRVKNEAVREIPPIALSWFDPELGRYDTTHSRPVAVSVRAATVVSAADVVRPSSTSDDADETNEAVSDAATQAPSPPASPAQPAFTLEGAELSIETRPESLSRNPVPWYARVPALGAMYLGGLSMLALAFVRRRQAEVDPVLSARRLALKAERRAVEQASAAGDVAKALRRMAATATSFPRTECDALLAECDNLAYAPGAGRNAPINPQLKERALVVADAMLEATR